MAGTPLQICMKCCILTPQRLLKPRINNIISICSSKWPDCRAQLVRSELSNECGRRLIANKMRCNSLRFTTYVEQNISRSVLLTCVYSHSHTRAFMAAKWIPIYLGTDRSLWVKHAEILRNQLTTVVSSTAHGAPIVRDGCCRQEDLNKKQISSTMASWGTRGI